MKNFIWFLNFFLLLYSVGKPIEFSVIYILWYFFVLIKLPWRHPKPQVPGLPSAVRTQKHFFLALITLGGTLNPEVCPVLIGLFVDTTAPWIHTVHNINLENVRLLCMVTLWLVEHIIDQWHFRWFYNKLEDTTYF